MVLGPVAKNVSWFILGHLVRILLQFGYLVLSARFLGPEGYGAFASVIAVMAAVAPLSGWGQSDLVVKRLATSSENFALYLGRAINIVFITGGILAALTCVLAWLWFGDAIPIKVVFLVAMADLIFARILDIAFGVFKGIERLGKAASLFIILSGARLAIALVIIYLIDNPSLSDWVYSYIIGSVLAAIFSIFIVGRAICWPCLNMKNLRSDISHGKAFAIALAAQRFNNNLDKIILPRLGGMEIMGAYSAAFRILESSIIPVAAIQNATYARFFRHGKTGLGGARDYARRILPIGVGYALVVGAVIYYFAPVVVFILGDQFKLSADILRWFSILPLLYVINLSAANVLVAGGMQHVRSVAQSGIVVINLGLLLLLIPKLSWVGAVIAVVTSECLMGIAMWFYIIYSIKSSHNKRSNH